MDDRGVSIISIVLQWITLLNYLWGSHMFLLLKKLSCVYVHCYFAYTHMNGSCNAVMIFWEAMNINFFQNPSLILSRSLCLIPWGWGTRQHAHARCWKAASTNVKFTVAFKKKVWVEVKVTLLPGVRLVGPEPLDWNERNSIQNTGV